MCFLLLAELMQGQKMMLEYEKYNELQAKSTRMQEDYERQLRDAIQKGSDGTEELTEFYEEKLQDANNTLNQVHQ